MPRAVRFRVVSSKAVKQKSSFSDALKAQRIGSQRVERSRSCLGYAVDRSLQTICTPARLRPGSHPPQLPAINSPLAKTPTEGSLGQNGLLSLQVPVGWLCVPGTKPIFSAPKSLSSEEMAF